MLCPHCNQPMPGDRRPSVNRQTGDFFFRGKRARLTLAEADIAQRLLSGQEWAVGHEALCGYMGDRFFDCENEPSNTLRVHIARMRKKLAPLGINITSAWGVGYAMTWGGEQPGERGGSQHIEPLLTAWQPAP